MFDVARAELKRGLMSETVRPLHNVELRQGDILSFEPKEGPPRYGVIINADCDLSNSKHDGVIAYLPMYEFAEYLQIFWAPRFVEEQIASKRKQLADKFDVSSSEIEDLISWLRLEAAEIVAAAFGSERSLKGKQIEELKTALSSLKALCRDSESAFDKFCRACREDKEAERFTRKRVEEAHKNMGDGHFFVSEVADLPRLGFVVRMRRIYSIPQSQCFRTRAEALAAASGTAPVATRIASFAAPYRYRIAQLFAQQFSRIGLPDEITSLSEIALSDVVDQISKRPS